MRCRNYDALGHTASTWRPFEISRRDKGRKKMSAEVIPFPAVEALDNVPVDLRELRGWLLWRREGDRKVPYYVGGGPRRGKQGSEEDRAKLVTFNEARVALRRGGYSGLGLAMLPDYELTALDFDDCMTDGVVHPEVLKLTAGTYAEISPSGTGVRAFIRGTLAGADKSAEGLARHGFKFEAYAARQFVTVTGNVINQDPDDLAGASICDLTDAVREHAKLRFPKPAEREQSPDQGKPHALTAADVRDMLAHMPDNVDRDRWKDTLFALERTALTSKNGLLKHDVLVGLADEWSRRGNPESYTGRQDVERKMLEAHRRESGFGVGSLWQWAQAGGWVPTDAQKARLHPDRVAAASEFEDRTAEALKTEQDKRDPFAFVSLWELADRPLQEWFIDGLIPQAQLGMIYGPPGCGKSFFAFDLALHLARGIPWRGRETKQARVAWIAAEASGSVGVRIRAYEQEFDTGRDYDIPVLAHAPDLGKRDHVDKIVNQMLAHRTQVLVVDTLSAAAGGREENSSEIDQVISGCRYIARTTGALVILIHHSGKDAARGARGWSGIVAAMDFELAVARVTDTDRVVRVTKQRDAEDGKEFGFRLRPVAWVMSPGTERMASSCVVEAAEVTARASGTVLRTNERAVREALMTLSLGGAEVTVGDLIDLAATHLPHDPEAKRDRRREYARLAIGTCQDKGVLRVEGDCVRLVAVG
jgi:archaellum biogenesis ATPase FlaH